MIYKGQEYKIKPLYVEGYSSVYMKKIKNLEKQRELNTMIEKYIWSHF